MATNNEFVLAGNLFDRKWELQEVTASTNASDAHQVNSDSCSVYQIFADNTANSYPLYIKIWDNGSAVATNGSTVADPDFIFPIPANETIDFSFLGQAMSLSNALRLDVSKDKGNDNTNRASAYNAISVVLYGTD
tara:strand:+ start:2851 stop:3255 length:405 start_codon:yes stop_codon:yes gene_type:complete